MPNRIKTLFRTFSNEFHLQPQAEEYTYTRIPEMVDPDTGAIVAEHMEWRRTGTETLEDFVTENSRIVTYNAKDKARFHECEQLSYRKVADATPIAVYDDIPHEGSLGYAVSPSIIMSEVSRLHHIPPLNTVFDVEHLRLGFAQFGDALCEKQMRWPRAPFDSGFNILTFIREAKDIEGAWKHLLSYRKRLMRLKKAFGPQFRKGNSFREISRLISEEVLHWSFGLLPLISDIRKIVNIMCSYARIVDEVSRGQKHTFRYMHASGLDSPGDPPLKGVIADAEWRLAGEFKGVGRDLYTRLRWENPQWKGYLQFYYRMQADFSSFRMRFNAMLDLLGAQPDPQFIWDAIPFSFVLDWVFDFGDYLHGHRYNWCGDAALIVTDAAYHYRATLVRDWAFESAPGVYNTTIGAETVRVFLRRKYLPSATQTMALRTLGVKQLILAGSLVAVRMRRA